MIKKVVIEQEDDLLGYSFYDEDGNQITNWGELPQEEKEKSVSMMLSGAKFFGKLI